MNTEQNIDQIMNEIFDEETARIEIPEGLEDCLSALIDKLDEKEAKARKQRSMWLWIGSAAAAITLIFATGAFYLSKTDGHFGSNPNYAVSDIDDPEVAYRETVKALTMVSQNFNKGMDQLALAETKANEANTIINKTIKDLKK